MNYSDIGDVAYVGTDDDMQNYTFTVEAVKTDGEEGFLIPFAVQSKDENYFWNLGGWGNTVSCLQKVSGGGKTGQLLKTASDFTVETGRTYQLKVVVSGTRVQCCVDGECLIDYDTGNPAEANAYCVVSTDETGDIIVKYVNVTAEKRTVAFDFGSAAVGAARVQQLSGSDPDFANTFGEAEDNLGVEEFTLSGLPAQFNLTVPAYSVTVLRLADQH